MAEKGIPNIIMSRENHVIKLRPALIPSVNVALLNYESHGGHLTRPQKVPFGQDPLANNPALQQRREHLLLSKFPLDTVFHTCVNKNPNVITRCILYFIHLTYSLAR